MFGSSIIDIAIGMVFVYLLLSLICSAANEMIERFSRKRARDLENGIKEMLGNDPKLVRKLYEHPLIYSLFAKPYKTGGKNLPSYIPARNFALALMDLATAKGGLTGATGIAGTSTAIEMKQKLADARASLAANPNALPPKVHEAVMAIFEASDHPAKVRQNLENWFDSAMDRVSGVYKRRSQLIVAVIGLTLAVLLNVDSVALVRALSTDRAMRDSLVAAAQEYARNNPAPTPTSSPESAANPASQPAASPSPTASRPRATPAQSPASTPTASAAASPSPSPSPRAAPADKCDTPECRVNKNLSEIKKLGLPIGWTREVSDPPDPRQIYGISFQGWILRMIGWLVTALALSLGAPFWFDLLNKFMVIRGTVKPKEKSPEEQSKD